MKREGSCRGQRGEAGGWGGGETRRDGRAAVGGWAHSTSGALDDDLATVATVDTRTQTGAGRLGAKAVGDAWGRGIRSATRFLTGGAQSAFLADPRTAPRPYESAHFPIPQMPTVSAALDL